VNFSKTEGNFSKWGGIIFAKQGETGKIGGNSKFVVDDKKGHQKFWREKVKF